MTSPLVDKRAKVDMGSNILLTRACKWPLGKLVLIVAGEGASMAVGCIECPRFVAVVDGEQEAAPSLWRRAHQQMCCAFHPAQSFQIDFCAPAILKGRPGYLVVVQVAGNCKG